MKINIKKPNLTDYQNEILYCGARFTITVASTKCGKTFSHIWWLFEMAHKPEAKANQHYWWIAPVYAQAKIAFERMSNKLLRHSGYKINQSNMSIKCPNGAIINFLSADNPNSLYGEDVYAVVIDEASRCGKNTWQAVRSTITATKAQVKIIGNYVAAGDWMMQLAEKAKTDSNYAYYKIDAYDAVAAGILDEEEVEQAKKDLTKKEFDALYLAIGSDDDSQIIAEESLAKLSTNVIQDGVKRMTIDVARLGKDNTVAFVWSGLKIIDYLVIERGKLTEQARRLEVLRLKHNINKSNCVADENGVGGGLIDIMGITGFINNAAPIRVEGSKQNFASLKDQCLYKLAELINANEIGVQLPHDTLNMLIDELRQIKLPKELDTQRIRFIGKDIIKKNIGRSPDYSDAVMMLVKFLLNPNAGTYAFV